MSPADAAIAAAIADPAASFWVKDALRTAQPRDPVDAAHDAKWVARLLADRADAPLGDAAAG